MNLDAKKENLNTLQNLLGMDEHRSERLISSPILISSTENFTEFSKQIKHILQKTFESVTLIFNERIQYSCEIVIDQRQPKTSGPYIYIGHENKDEIIISSNPPSIKFYDKYHPFVYFLISCYASAFVLKTLNTKVPHDAIEEIKLDLNSIIGNEEIFRSPVDIREAYLVGAGAIGNAFLYALSTFDVHGEMKIVDPDFVSGGNLNRCLFFGEEDISKTKVEVLSEKAQPLFKNLKLSSVPFEFAKMPHKPHGAWLKKLIVGVDSRRARRNLQREIPYEVFDASTTDIREVVVHHHKRPLIGACLGCIYVREQQEDAHSKHIAETLGVTLEQVRRQFIDMEAANAIAKRYGCESFHLIGLSFDTLFKQLCGEGKLKDDVKQVLAPFAFVSALAGAFLALSVVQKHLRVESYNYWRISPWTSPNFRLKQNIPTNPECEFCNDKTYNKVASELWH